MGSGLVLLGYKMYAAFINIVLAALHRGRLWPKTKGPIRWAIVLGYSLFIRA